MIELTPEEVTNRLMLERNITPAYAQQVKMKAKMDRAREIEIRNEKHDLDKL